MAMLMQTQTALSALSLSAILGAFYFASPFHGKATAMPLRGAWYEDEDGVASPTSVKSHAQETRRTRTVIQLSSVIGLVSSTASAILLGFSLHPLMITIGWIIVSVDGIFFARAPSPARQYAVGLWISFSATALSFALVIDMYASYSHADYTISQIAQWMQLALTLVLTVAGSCLPRRPAVYQDGQIVDAQYTCSAIERYTFAWTQALLRQTRTVSRLEYADLPMLDYNRRSRALSYRFSAAHGAELQNSLWKAIFRDHRAEFYRQWSLAVVESCVMMLPPLCLYKVLLLLERRKSTESVTDPQAWLWIACLAVSKLVHFGLDTWLHWVSFGCLATPVRAQLSALIFAKSLRLKIVDTSHRPGPSLANDDEEAHETDDLLLVEGNEESGNSAEEDVGNAISRGVVNLLGVDVERVSDFCGYNVDLIRGFVKAFIATGSLIALLGWISTLAGFTVPLLLGSVNRVATRHYTAKQLAVMSARDIRSHVTEEVLHGIRQIKLSAYEPEWGKSLLAARERELKEQRKVYIWATFLTFCWIAMPILIGATALSVYAWVSPQMTASVAFTALAVFSSLEYTISAVPATITEMLDARVSASRIQEHLNSIEREENLQPGPSVQFTDADISWPSNDFTSKGFMLEGLNLEFPPGELSLITGKTGTGKSLLLAAIIGEADLLRGQITSPKSNNISGHADHLLCDNWIVPTAIAYVGQVPWIENASVKESILYGFPYHRERYAGVLYACALDQDIEMLPDGDATEIGATGVNLSGGQRWRLTFARALYSRAAILVLDDIFSAVDAHVGRHILEHGVAGNLGAGRTIILATHHVGLVENIAGYMVNLDDGTSSRLKRNSGDARHQPPHGIYNQALPSTPVADNLHDEESSLADSEVARPRKFVQEETREHGRIKWNVYRMYIMASGGWQFWTSIMVVFTLSALTVICRSYWLTLWTEAYTPSTSKQESDAQRHDSSEEPSLRFYLSIYLLISMLSVLIISVKVALVLVASLRAARHMFEKAMDNVLRAPLRWLDTEPTGRILNRLVGDFAMIDSRLGRDLMWFLTGAFSIGSILLTVLFVSIWMLIPMAVLAGICIRVVSLYLDGARDLKRLESSSKSPVFEHVGSALSGLATIRSFCRTDDYLDRMFRHIDRHTQTSWYVLVMSQWMKFRQGAIGVGFTLVIAVGVAYLPGITAAVAGFALSFALEFSSVAEETITRYASMELDMNSSERAHEYMQLDTEPATGDPAPEDWPQYGRIDVTDLQVGYAPDLPAVLKGVSFHVHPCERIGIVGRTGSGKSSLTLALFRFLEAREGAIEIDGVNISRIKLHDLRSRLAIIPQDPVLFSGTVRSNLDPFHEHPDSVLWQALQRIDPSQSSPGEASSESDSPTDHTSVFRNLDSPVSRGGSNLSQGEKQLLCLARAMITRPKILVLDEATSAVDMETDSLMQRSIREEFHNATLLVIAHRLSTVADFDKLLVMSDGKVAEFGPPGVLARQDGVFRRMIQDSGEITLRHLLQ